MRYVIVVALPPYHPNPMIRAPRLDVHKGGLDDSIGRGLTVRDAITPHAVIIREVDAHSMKAARARGREILSEYRRTRS